MKITINNRDTIYTIDTYSIFTLDNAYDSEYNYYATELDIDENLIDFDYNVDGYIKMLSNESIELLKDYFKDSKIIKSFKLLNSKSPQFYNYTTDSYDMIIDYRITELKKYILANYDKWVEFAKTEWCNALYNVDFYTKMVDVGRWSTDIQDYIQHYISIFKDDNCITSMLDYYTRNNFTYDDYIDSMYEVTNELQYEFIYPSDTLQTVLNKMGV